MRWRHWAQIPVTSRQLQRHRSRGAEVTSWDREWRQCATWNARCSDIYRLSTDITRTTITTISLSPDDSDAATTTVTWPVSWRHRRRCFRRPNCCGRCTTPQWGVSSAASSVPHPYTLHTTRWPTDWLQRLNSQTAQVKHLLWSWRLGVVVAR